MGFPTTAATTTVTKCSGALVAQLGIRALLQEVPNTRFITHVHRVDERCVPGLHRLDVHTCTKFLDEGLDAPRPHVVGRVHEYGAVPLVRSTQVNPALITGRNPAAQ